MDKFDEKIIGYEATKNILRQILDTLKRPELYKSKGASIPRGLLMESDPGLGKSLLATVFIKESGRKSLVFRKTSQENSFLDELRAAFLAAKEAAPSILLLEDLNLYVESNSPYAPEWACLQACIDDAKNTDIFVIATTNLQLERLLRRLSAIISGTRIWQKMSLSQILLKLCPR